MSDIFISYAREDLERTKQLAAVLDNIGWKVFIDRRIPAGKTWADYIGKELENSKCVIVVWSQASLASRFVKLEANNALNKGKLIPILIEDVSPPFEFGDLHAADLINWDGDEESDEFRNLITDIKNLIGDETKSEISSQKNKTPRVKEKKKPVEENITLDKIIVGRWNVNISQPFGQPISAVFVFNVTGQFSAEIISPMYGVIAVQGQWQVQNQTISLQGVQNVAYTSQPYSAVVTFHNISNQLLEGNSQLGEVVRLTRL